MNMSDDDPTEGLASPSERKETIDTIKRWFEVIVIGCGVTLLSAFVLSLVVYKVVTDKADERDNDRITRIVETCKQYNADQTRNRAFAHEQLVEVAGIFGGPDRADQLRNDPRLGTYDQFAAEQFPYRQCKPEACALSYTDPNVPDCPFAQTEEG